MQVQPFCRKEDVHQYRDVRHAYPRVQAGLGITDLVTAVLLLVILAGIGLTNGNTGPEPTFATDHQHQFQQTWSMGDRVQ